MLFLAYISVWFSKCVCLHNKEKHLRKLSTRSKCVCHQLRYTAKRRVCKLPCLRGISAQTHTYARKHIVVFPQTSWDLELLCWQIKTPKHPKTIFHSEDGTQVFVYSLLHSITPSSVCLTFHTHGLIFYLVALQICKLMPQLSAEAACGVEFIKPACPPARLCVRTSHNDGIPS